MSGGRADGTSFSNYNEFSHIGLAASYRLYFLGNMSDGGLFVLPTVGYGWNTFTGDRPGEMIFIKKMIFTIYSVADSISEVWEG